MDQLKQLKSKFLGSILGSVIGDSWGARYEGKYYGSFRVEDFQLVGGMYTDDSEMMKGVLQSLISNMGEFNGSHMANTFVKNYDYRRGYGPGTISVLMKIKEGHKWDQPAKEVFDGTGSFGNGAAMRICPVGLLYNDNLEKLIEIADQVSTITHTHPLGREGAVLQAYSVALAVQSNPRTFEPIDFIEKLQSIPYKLSSVYQKKLEKIHTYLISPPSREKAIRELGVDVAAPDSVPIAIYNFLNDPTNFYEVLHSSISCGGDTDTIACMSGAIAGAFLGLEKIPKNWLDIQEENDLFRQLAEELFELFIDKKT
ncbi:MAG: ADP-ribosylglycohydrolase family protein [Candidatus Heimdallarchaeota archaeon]|nr:MAG: ADP-ribosylglycohydrolase family protein [Candidatus Heimdallarchaeota archaeon]